MAQYKISEKELENVTLFVPAWFTEAIMSGVEESELKALIRENLETAYELAKRPALNEEQMSEKVDDLYATYVDVFDEYKEEVK